MSSSLKPTRKNDSKTTSTGVTMSELHIVCFCGLPLSRELGSKGLIGQLVALLLSDGGRVWSLTSVAMVRVEKTAIQPATFSKLLE